MSFNYTARGGDGSSVEEMAFELGADVWTLFNHHIHALALRSRLPLLPPSPGDSNAHQQEEEEEEEEDSETNGGTMHNPTPTLPQPQLQPPLTPTPTPPQPQPQSRKGNCPRNTSLNPLLTNLLTSYRIYLLPVYCE